MQLDTMLARGARFFLLPLLLFPVAPKSAGAVAAASAICTARPGPVHLLAEISNTRDANVDCLGVRIEGNAITALLVESHHSSGGDRSTRTRVEEFPVSQIASTHGAVLDGAQGHDAVIVRGSVSPRDGHAQLVTSYLYNGLTGEYRSCPIRIDRADAAAAWRLVNRFNETVSHIVVRTRSIPLLGTIGIDDLEGVCSPVI